ncbi:Amidase [Penicillium italicum]|uniref:Amidase n=1 Tax=Penicillium italicum TaxID=40296 RepID=A0A0A2L8V2_PENIT|nr:Amidase [Penicillium italicum]
MVSQEPRYVAVAQRKQAELAAAIPAEWWLPAHLIPEGMLSISESITVGPKSYQRVGVMDIPRTRGLLTSKELEITEKYDVRGLVGEMTEGRLKAEDVVGGFCKRAAIAHQLTRCLTEPLFDHALQRARELDDHFQRTGTPIGPLHGLPVSVKDTFNIKGVDSSIGLSALAFEPAKANAPLVDLLKSLGAVVIAKTNVPQTLATLDSCNHLFGRMLNPLNRQWTAGGSTGGEGALIAMGGSMVGFGTDIGGSIRVPAMCQGIYGFKPSNGRVPYGGQQSGQIEGKGRIGLQAVAGPLARSVADINAIMAEIVPRAELFGEDCIPGSWSSQSVPFALTSPYHFTIGVLKTDGLVTPLPPIARILNEVADRLRHTPGVEVVEIPLPSVLPKCQALAGRLMGIDDGSHMLDLIESMGEDLIPWLQGRMKRGKALSVVQLATLQAQRAEIEKEMMKIWTLSSQGSSVTRRVDAIICPVAPHPVPEIDRYNAVGYASMFVLLDYPAGTVPVRSFTESDLEIGREMEAPVLGSWDKANRQLWDERTVDRRVYLGSPLSVQVVTPKQHDHKLFRAMEIVDRAVQGRGSSTSAKL